jgi:hypothetical protein
MEAHFHCNLQITPDGHSPLDLSCDLAPSIFYNRDGNELKIITGYLTSLHIISSSTAECSRPRHFGVSNWFFLSFSIADHLPDFCNSFRVRFWLEAYTRQRVYNNWIFALFDRDRLKSALNCLTEMPGNFFAIFSLELAWKYRRPLSYLASSISCW